MLPHRILTGFMRRLRVWDCAGSQEPAWVLALAGSEPKHIDPGICLGLNISLSLCVEDIMHMQYIV